MYNLIDADVLVYRIGYACQKTVYQYQAHDGSSDQWFYNQTIGEIKKKLKEEGITKEDGKLRRFAKTEQAAHTLHSAKIMAESISDYIELTLGTEIDSKLFLTSDDKSNFRFKKAISHVYKGNRKQPRPRAYDLIRNYYIDNFNASVTKDQEADDAMGIAQCKYLKKGKRSIISSIDKDMWMIPGLHYNIVTHKMFKASDPGELELSEDKRKLTGFGKKWFYAQMLLGDSADNIKGIRGMGPVTVYKLLQSANNESIMLIEVLEQYKKFFKDNAVDRLLENADLLWIRRREGQIKSEHIKKLLKEV